MSENNVVYKKHNRSCCVKGCTQAVRTWIVKSTNTQPAPVNITFHSIPRQKEIRSTWIKALGWHNGSHWVVMNSSKVGSLHLGEYSWEKQREDGKKKLKWAAVPLHFKLRGIASPPQREHFAFAHPHCSEVFQRKPGLSDITNQKRSVEHSYAGILRPYVTKMPQYDGSAPSGKNVKSSRISIPRHIDGDVIQYLPSSGYRLDVDPDTSSIPPMLRLRLRELFSQIEREFENLYAENAHLQEKIDTLSEKLERESVVYERQGYDSVDFDSGSKSASKQKSLAGSSQKLKTAHKLRAQTSKIVSSFKGPTVSCTLVQEFSGHRDGVWDVAVARPGQPVIGTASADHSACIWSTETGKCLLEYRGHVGSVNSIRFHPSRDVVLTAGGDEKAHIWQAAVTWEDMKPPSVEEEEAETRVDREDYGDDSESKELPPILRTPLRELSGHSNAVIAADWLPGGDQLITASWDRTANLYDVETGEILQTLCGHDQGLTHTSSHHSQRLVVTSSRDTTFRLWDFREAIHSVSVFQGHTDTVTCAIFSRDDKVVSGSDDRAVKVWDMRNMRSPLATIRSDSAANRLAVSASGVIAIPHDNRNVRLFDLSGNRIARLPRTSRQGHRRMVCCVTWGDENSGYPSNFYSCGFDRLVLGWSIHPCKEN